MFPTDTDTFYALEQLNRYLVFGPLTSKPYMQDGWVPLSHGSSINMKLGLLKVRDY